MIQVKTLLTRLKASRKRIATERDKLRRVISEFEDLDDDTTEALDDLDRAIEALSRLQ